MSELSRLTVRVECVSELEPDGPRGVCVAAGDGVIVAEELTHVLNMLVALPPSPVVAVLAIPRLPRIPPRIPTLLL
eukprot:3493146-Rhodomonas_salina.3